MSDVPLSRSPAVVGGAASAAAGRAAVRPSIRAEARKKFRMIRLQVNRIDSMEADRARTGDERDCPEPFMTRKAQMPRFREDQGSQRIMLRRWRPRPKPADFNNSET